jgi:glycosyltransferase involved in cell wall biosynthesis
MVRDECDIIELFVRINSRVIDHFYIIDNHSVDRTKTILEKLIQDGFPITIYSSDDNTYNQAILINQALQNIQRTNKHDWFLFLDADEFLDNTKEDVLEALEATPKHTLPSLMWRSWVPNSLDYHKTLTPLFSNFEALAEENHKTYKVAVHKTQAPHLVLSRGAHSATFRGNQIPLTLTPIRINHFPVRSPDQISSKAILSCVRERAISISGTVRSVFSTNTIVGNLREHNWEIDLPRLRYFAIAYNTWLPPTGSDPQTDSTIKGIGFGTEQDIIRLPEMSIIRLAARFDYQILMMNREILTLKKT